MRGILTRWFMKHFGLIIIGICVALSGWGQTAEQADALFGEQQYAEAQAAYQSLLQRAPKNALYLYRYARCAYEQNDYATAETYFLKAGNRYALRDFYLGEIYTRTYQFEKAIAAYQAYQDAIEPDHERYPYVEQQIAQAEKGARYMRRVADIAIVDSVILPKAAFLQAYKLSAEAGTLTIDSAGLATYTNQRNDRRILTAQGAERKCLLSTQRLLDGWGTNDTLHLDVQGNCNYPFVLSDGLTLYFASDDAAGLGGYDIYLTRYNAAQNTYLTPENVGFPFNSPANDYMLAIDETHHRGYFATDRFTGDSLVAIYTFIPNNETRVLRNVDSTYLLAAAQLKVYRTETQQTPIVRTDAVEIQQATETDAQFLFVVNDSIVCRSLSDFESLDAQSLMKDYLHTTKEIQRTAAALQQARAQYAKAEPAVRIAMAQTILQYEKSLPQLQRESEELAAQIRLLELRAQVSNEL